MPLSHADFLKLKRWNTPTISNAVEQITQSDRLTLANREEARDFMPEMGPMMGYAMTVVMSGGDPKIQRDQPDNMSRMREYLAGVAGPKIVVVQRTRTSRSATDPSGARSAPTTPGPSAASGPSPTAPSAISTR